jgi:dihydroorotate dehydrogenase
LLFKQDPEVAHERAVQALRVASALGPVRWLLRVAVGAGGGGEPVRALGLDFPNRVGLAAGFDKNAVCWPALAALGFGHVEVGTITLKPQDGNPKPRVFRYPEAKAVINRMGFNNDGAEAIARRLARAPKPGRRPVPIGINIGKSRVASIDQAVADYAGSFRLLADHADYVALNVSSPNTPELRRLQDGDRLGVLLEELSALNRSRGSAARPILLKIAPDLSFPQIDAILQAVADHGLAGIIATNTTVARPGAFSTVSEGGGLSGPPLRRRSTEIIRYISHATSGRLPIIGVGGLDDAISACEKLDAGATLVQLYTGLIFEGPLLVRELARATARNSVFDRIP